MSEDFEIRVVAHSRCRGPVPAAVETVAGQGPDGDKTYVAVVYGNVALLLEDWEALTALVDIVDRVATLGELVFPLPDLQPERQQS